MKDHWGTDSSVPQDVTFQTYDFIDHVTSSGPTCEDLGIPRDSTCAVSSSFGVVQKHRHGPGLRFQVLPKQENDPFSPDCLIPLPSPFGMSIFDATCFRRRNERERDRVRCVNDGYLRLKQHLPIENKAKRLSKVETLRYAIKYIKFLEDLLNNSDSEDTSKRRKVCVHSDDEDDKMTRVPTNSNHGNLTLELSEDDFDTITDTSDYESKCDTGSEADMSDELTTF